MKGIYVLLSGLLLSLANPIESFAHERYNALPHQVINTLDHRYGNFDLIHSRSFYKHGKLRYNLLIQHRRSYVWVTIGVKGRMIKQKRYHKYPLANHYCNNECRFHFQHYRGNGFVSFDPFSGCSAHFAIVGRSQGRSQYASLGHSDWYYQPNQKHYKRLKHRKYGYYSPKKKNHKKGSRGDQYHEHDHSARHDKPSKHSNGYSEPKERYKQRSRTNRKDRRSNYMYYVDPSDAHARRNGR